MILSGADSVFSSDSFAGGRQLDLSGVFRDITTTTIVGRQFVLVVDFSPRRLSNMNLSSDTPETAQAETHSPLPVPEFPKRVLLDLVTDCRSEEHTSEL